VNQTLAQGLPAVVVAAALYGSAPALQAAAARRTSPGAGLGLRLLGRLVLRPLWLLGLACEIGGFVAEVCAFSVAPAALVAPLLTADMVFLVLLARRGLGERLAIGGMFGILTMALATALMAFAFGEVSTLGSPASHAQMLVFAIGGALAAAVGTIIGDRGAAAGRSWLAALGFGVAAGVAYGIATLATRQVGLTFDIHDPWPLLTTPTPYVLVVSSVLAISLLQRGLQAGASVLTFPVTSFVSSFLPVVLATTMLGEQVPGNGHRIAFIVALLAVAVGVVLLGRDRATAEQQHRISGRPASEKSAA
jgi:drug/metabolite transporter (DMT)-like permease